MHEQEREKASIKPFTYDRLLTIQQSLFARFSLILADPSRTLDEVYRGELHATPNQIVTTFMLNDIVLSIGYSFNKNTQLIGKHTSIYDTGEKIKYTVSSCQSPHESAGKLSRNAALSKTDTARIQGVRDELKKIFAKPK